MKDKTLAGLDCTIMIQHSVILLMLGPMIPEIMSAYNIAEGTAGLILSAGSLGSTIGPLIAGFTIDKKGLKFAIITGFLFETVFLILFGLAPFFWLAAVFNLMLVLSSGFIETSVNVIPALLKGKNTVSVMNLVHFFFSVGAFITPLLIGLFISAGGRWQSVVLAAAVPTVVLGVFFLFIKFTHHPHKYDKTEKPSGIGGLLSNRTVVLGALTLFLYVGGELGFSSWIVSYLEKKLSYGKMQASMGMSMFWIGIMAGRMTNSILARKLNSTLLITASAVLCLAAGIPFLFSAAVPAVFSLLFLIGLSMAGGYPVTMAEINSRFPGRTGTVSGILTFGAGLGAMVFQWLMGFTAEHAGMAEAMIIPLVLIVLMAVFFRLALRK